MGGLLQAPLILQIYFLLKRPWAGRPARVMRAATFPPGRHMDFDQSQPCPRGAGSPEISPPKEGPRHPPAPWSGRATSWPQPLPSGSRLSREALEFHRPGWQDVVAAFSYTVSIVGGCGERRGWGSSEAGASSHPCSSPGLRWATGSGQSWGVTTPPPAHTHTLAAGGSHLSSGGIWPLACLSGGRKGSELSTVSGPREARSVSPGQFK